jgi:uncharacterized membrane protein
MKNQVEKAVKAPRKRIKGLCFMGFAVMTAVSLFAVQASAASAINFGTIDFTTIKDTITAVIPVALPSVITMIAIRKGLSLFFGMIRGG